MTEAAVAAPAAQPERKPELPRYRDTPRQWGRWLYLILTGLLAAAALAILVFIIVFRTDRPEAFGFGITYAIIPLPLLWFCYWWLDRYEPEPRRYKIAAFVWGAAGAVGIAYVLEGLFAAIGVRDQELASFVAPLVEEPAKGLFLFLTFLRWRRVLDGFLDGVILAGIVGLGFAFSENILYYTSSYLGGRGIPIDGAGAATATFVVRGIFSPFAHPLFTSALGIGLGMAVLTRSWPLKIAYTLAGGLGAVLMHAMWNGSLSYVGGGGFFLAYLFLGALFFTLAIVAIIVRVRQLRVLDSSLAYIAERGWIHPAEIPYLSRFTYRRKARRYAKENGGRLALKAVRRYQRLATEVSFLHQAIMTGRHLPHGIERTYALLDAMHDVRPYVLLPPALPPTPVPLQA